jgi:hypothetical protein
MSSYLEDTTLEELHKRPSRSNGDARHFTAQRASQGSPDAGNSPAPFDRAFQFL